MTIHYNDHILKKSHKKSNISPFILALKTPEMVLMI